MKKYLTFFILTIFLLSCGCSESNKDEPSAKDYYTKAYHFIDSGFPQEAINLYALAIEKDPEFIDAYYNRAIVYFTLREYDKALADLNRVIEKRPDMALAYASRGSVYDRLGDNLNALKDYKKAAQLGDKDTQEYLKSKNLRW